MIIKSIEMYNFRQYKGLQTINFKHENDKNVTVIIGKNTSGKTTIVQAFNWCLYEKRNFKTKDIINLEAIEMISPLRSISAHVEIILIHDKKEYTIRRSQEFEKNAIEKVTARRTDLEVQYKDESGSIQSIPKNEFTNTIKKILPEELSDYFFFDGERIGDITNKGDIVSAVRALMGLDVVSEACDMLNPLKKTSVTYKFKNELDLGSDNKNRAIKIKLDNESKNLSKFEKQLTNCEEEIEYSSKHKEELGNKILGFKEVKQLKTQELNIEREINLINKTVMSLKTSIKKQFGVESNSLGFFVTPFIEKALAVLDKSKTVAAGVPAMRIEAIDYLIKRKTCLCGNDLENDVEARRLVEYERTLLPPQHIGTEIREYKRTLNRLSNNSEGFYEKICEDFKNLKTNVTLLDSKKVDLENTKKKIDEIGNVDVELLEKDYRVCSKKITELNSKKSSLERNLGAAESSIKSLNGEIQRLSVVNEKNAKLLRCLAYTEEIYKWFESEYHKEEKEVKEKLLKSVNKTFKKMYHGDREVTMNDKYLVSLETRVGDRVMSTDESKGLEAVKNFAFITGLVDLARERAREQCNNDDSIFYSEPFPLVMDAPFSNVDEVHIDNISGILPDAAEQVILILMQKDWDHSEKAIKHRVASKYYIDKVNNSETYSKIEPL